MPSYLNPAPEDSYAANTSSSSYNYSYNSTTPERTVYETASQSQFETAETFNARWKSRRRMAWLSLAAIFIATIAIFFFVPIARLEVIKEVMAWFYMAMTSVVGFYMGATTWAYVKR